MHWALELNRPLVNGYSGVRSKLMREYPGQLVDFPDARSLKALARIAGLRYIIYLGSKVPNFNRATFLAGISDLSPTFVVDAEDNENNFLIQFYPRALLSNRPSILVAPGAKALEIAIKCPTPTAIACPFSIWIDSVRPGVPYLRSELPANSSFLKLKIDLPQTLEQVNPLKLTLQSECQQDLWFEGAQPS